MKAHKARKKMRARKARNKRKARKKQRYEGTEASNLQRKLRFNWRKQCPSEKIVIVEKELDCIHRDDIGNLEDLLKLVFINEECGNPKVVVDSGEHTQKRKAE